MASNPPPFFTTLTQPADTVSQSTPSSPFDANIAYLLGQCCNLAYDQFADGGGSTWAPDWSSLVFAGSTVSLASQTNPQPLTMCEALGPALGPIPIAGDAGYYVQLPAGFAVQLTLTPTGGGDAQTIVVIALRGTRTWQEWINDAEAVPVAFGTLGGTVHAGFFADYTVGTNGLVSSKPFNERAPGSLAAQVAAYVSQLPQGDDSLPLYVTGHSLGGALAALCALDVALNFGTSCSSLAMYSLASPRVAAGAVVAGVAGVQLSVETFVQLYQQNVPNTYAIVHAADIVPILPPMAISLPPGSSTPPASPPTLGNPSTLLSLYAAQVTDPLGGVGAVAAAQLGSTGGVASIDVLSSGSGYSIDPLPEVVISGGGGSGAEATASVSLDGTITVTVTAAGSGYTTAPTVQIVSTGSSLLANVISFCAQTGDIADNHSCSTTYVPYLAQLAAGFGS